MTKFKNEIDKELSYLKATDTANDIISKAEIKNKIITMPRAFAMVATLVLVFTIIFIPSNNNKSSFVIIANAESIESGATPDTSEVTGDVLDTENFVEIYSNEPNYIQYNFNYILDADADYTELAKKYLFHSFNKYLDITVEGDDIETITYKIHNGSLSSYTMLHEDRNIKKIHIRNTSSKLQTEMTINYDEQDKTDFRFNPIISTDDFHNDMDTLMITDKGEITNDTSDNVVGYGFKDKNTLATQKEIETLREYIKNDDMVGFYNYQNQIFKRIIDDITLDITVTKTNGETETQTLEFLYTPDLLKKLPEYNDAIEKHQTLSTGTLSAKIKK